MNNKINHIDGITTLYNKLTIPEGHNVTMEICTHTDVMAYSISTNLSEISMWSEYITKFDHSHYIFGGSVIFIQVDYKSLPRNLKSLVQDGV